MICHPTLSEPNDTHGDVIYDGCCYSDGLLLIVGSFANCLRQPAIILGLMSSIFAAAPSIIARTGSSVIFFSCWSSMSQTL